MLDTATAWVLLAWGLLIPGVSIAILIWINIHTRRKHRDEQ